MCIPVTQGIGARTLIRFLRKLRVRDLFIFSFFGVCADVNILKFVGLTDLEQIFQKYVCVRDQQAPSFVGSIAVLTKNRAGEI